ncbi:hypothetical protein, partial [Bradyrhizobium japonicum]
GECVRRLFFVIFAPDSQQESSPLSGRKSTQATVRICEASSLIAEVMVLHDRPGFAPYVERLERELAAMQSKDDVMTRARRRLAARGANDNGKSKVAA